MYRRRSTGASTLLDRTPKWTRALVGVRKLTGRGGSKFPDPEQPHVIRALDEAQRIFEEEKDRLEPVVVI